MTFLACACGKRYDVTTRAPGARVRCPTCNSVLVVPEPRASAGAVTASERLRRARGQPCARHPKAIAGRACAECQQWMCDDCRAPRPATHLCQACALRLEATRAIPLDFGLLATTAMAAKLGLRAIPRVVTFNVIANAIQYALLALLALPGLAVIGALDAANKADPASLETTKWTVVAGVLAGLILAIMGLFGAVLVPSSDVYILDGLLRRTNDTFGGALRGAAGRTLARTKALLGTYLCLLLVFVAAGLVCLPFLLLAYLTGVRELNVAGWIAAVLAIGGAFGVFGLALPAVVLEHRSATEAIERAWGLARLHPWTSAVLGAAVVVGGGLVALGFLVVAVAIQRAAGDDQTLRFVGSALMGVPSLFLDVVWSSLLVTAYHGLVAEESGIVGRASRV